jgi:uncharacterized membrane protein YfcA
VAFFVAVVASAMNSMAGGGTLLTFPTLIWLGLPSVTANATSTVAVWPGTAGSTLGYRKELLAAERRILALTAPSLAGGFIGALLLRRTPVAVFDALVPYLILFATVLFIVQEPILRRLKTTHAEAHKSTRWLAGATVFQFGVGLYGGYFGAGIGILMLAALGILGMTDIHQMNGLKSFFGACINLVAVLYFIWAKMVYWPYVLIMFLGSILGGYFGTHGARRIGQTAVRRIVIAVGFGMAVSLFIKH